MSRSLNIILIAIATMVSTFVQGTVKVANAEDDKPVLLNVSPFSYDPLYSKVSLDDSYLSDSFRDVFFSQDLKFQEPNGTGLGNNFRFQIGRQNYYGGFGHFWDLTHPLRRKSPLRFLYPMEPVNGAYCSYSFDGNNEISGFYGFDANPDATGSRDAPYQVNLKTQAKVWDLAIHYSETRQNRTDFEDWMMSNESPEDTTIPVRWKILTVGVRGKLGDMGIHAEGGHAWLNMENESREKETDSSEFARNHARFLVGVDYTFENELYLVIEYFQEGSGKNSADQYTLNDRLAFISGESDVIGKDNIMVGAKYPINQMTSIELYNIINANDASVIVNPWLVWSPGRDVSFKVSAQIPVGKEGSSAEELVPAAIGHIQLNF